ncbi:MAG: glycosyltransferase family 4 protein [Deltaproteobacteria bacterium]|jgi:mannosyltransferase|nr:glycosyltransferase family 4 protein [Deltaproteobacteria bacterium]
MNSDEEIEVILPNLNRRFSGVTGAVSAVVPHQTQDICFAQVGYQIPINIPRLSWRQLFRLTAKPLADGRLRIFHTRRNIEMLTGLILKYILRRKIHLLHTSAAQRIHSAWTCFLFRQMDTLIATSPRTATFLPRTPDFIIPHGVNIDKYYPAQDRLSEWANSGAVGKYGIGIFGRVRPQKGVQEYVDALCEVLPRHPDFTAIIVGETTPQFLNFEISLKNKIKKLGLEKRFLWLGKLKLEEVPLWFRCVSIVAAVSRNEGFGLTCLEAMASGAAVVATMTGAFDTLIRDGVDGFIIPCNDTTALAAALEKLLAAPEMTAQMGKAARQRVCDHYTIQKEAAAITKAYRAVFASTGIANK